MKTKRYILILISVLSVLTLYSCIDYLDKTEKADITSDDVFREFKSFEGFVESMYFAIVVPRRASGIGQNDPNCGDDVWNGQTGSNWIHDGNYYPTSRFYYFWSSVAAEHADLTDYKSGQGYGHQTWGGWNAIRAANIGLANLDRLEGATTEERNLLAGQCYFFRGYFHWELMRVWGGIPYIDTVFSPSSDMKIPALTFTKAAEKVLKDLEKAAELLPSDWDETEVGARTLGNNSGRLTKGAVLSFQAEVNLWLGSPLINGMASGSYTYNPDYCKLAAGYAWEVIKLADQGYYQLEPWATISDVFYTINKQNPGKKECIFVGRDRPYLNVSAFTKWQLFSRVGGSNFTVSVNANYVENYGMANGLPIDDPESGYNTSSPFSGRDPRFYKDLRYDRDRLAYTVPTTDARAFCQTYVGGADRGSNNTQTGYSFKKFIHPQVNGVDGMKGANYVNNVPRIRLAEIYLFYAEAVNEAYGPNVVPPDIPGASLTAVQAINIIRTRAGVPDVHSKYTTNKEDFRARIWSERAVELSFEVKRWYDLRRWYVAHLPEYKAFDALDFDKNWTYFKKRKALNHVFELRNYWLAFPVSQVSIYKEWPQNPGW